MGRVRWLASYRHSPAPGRFGEPCQDPVFAAGQRRRTASVV